MGETEGTAQGKAGNQVIARVNVFIAQGEGGEQGDPLMPLLFALGQHKSLVEAQARLSGIEMLLAFLDDIYTASMPGQGL